MYAFQGSMYNTGSGVGGMGVGCGWGWGASVRLCGQPSGCMWVPALPYHIEGSLYLDHFHQYIAATVLISFNCRRST